MTEEEQRNLDGVIEKLRRDKGTGDTTAPAPAPPPPSQADDFIPPTDIQDLLSAQLGEALKIMHDFTRWILHPNSDIQQALDVSHAIGSLMGSSATLGKLAIELRHGPSETRHRMIVEHVGEGRGSAKAENE